MHEFTRKYLAILVALAVCEQIAAQNGVTTFIKKVGTFLDTMSVKGVDRRYIDAPEKRWQLILKGNVSQGELSNEQICERIGYSRLQYFSAKFKEYYGLTLNEYRRQRAARPRAEDSE